MEWQYQGKLRGSKVERARDKKDYSNLLLDFSVTLLVCPHATQFIQAQTTLPLRAYFCWFSEHMACCGHQSSLVVYV